jgi:DnaK suppressor protein
VVAQLNTQLNTEQVRERLLARREELRARETYANAGLRQQAGAASGDFGDVSTLSEQNGLLTALSRAADAELKQVEYALARLRNGRYPRCAACGEDIEPQRLAAVPYTDRCFHCAEHGADD